MKKVTWNVVLKKCLKDNVFFEALVKNPNGTLGQAGMELSARDLKKLEGLVQDQTMMEDFRTYKKLWDKYHFTETGFAPIW
jgi:hypothetical protein